MICANLDISKNAWKREGIVYAKWTILFHRYQRIHKFETENRDLIYDDYNLYHQRVLRVFEK